MIDIDLEFLCEILKQSGRIALEMRSGLGQAEAKGMVTPYEVKIDETPVTAVDHRVEAYLIEQITNRYPGHAILTEESGMHSGWTPSAGSEGRMPSAPTNELANEFTWVIDPIDGTRSFANGLPIWGVSVGVLRGRVPWAGGFFMPMTNELFWGTPAQAFYNQRRLPRLNWTETENALTFLAVPSNFHMHFKVSYPRIRSLGSTAAHLAYVMSGSAVAALTRTVSLWDLAGILPLLMATGVNLAYLSGQPFEPGDLLGGKPASEPLLAAAPEVWKTLAARISLIPGS
jgi:fructose-1,6-bisphosphatase/inositol monophosphatase family enzyme